MKKLIVLITVILAFAGCTPVAAQSYLFHTDTLKNKAQEVYAGYVNPHLVNITNPIDTAIYIKFYDQKTKPFSTSVPIWILYIPQGTTTLLMNANIRFGIACWLRQSKTVTITDTSVYVTSHPYVTITW